MTDQTKTPRFGDGQRVKVVLFLDDEGIRYSLPADYIKQNGKTGCVMDARADSFPLRGSRRLIPSYGYEIMMMQTVDIIRVPEECLEPADHEIVPRQV